MRRPHHGQPLPDDRNDRSVEAKALAVDEDGHSLVSTALPDATSTR